MAEILPFKGIRYNQGKRDALEKVVAPPYDVITPEERDRLYEKSDYNVIRLILGKEFPGDNERDNKYSRAADIFQKWLREGILREDKEPAIYIYRQEYFHEGEKKTRRGLLALLKLEDFRRGIILPHEEILSRPREDRLHLLRACRANLCPIFTLYSDPARAMDGLLEEEREPLLEVEDDKREKHCLWAVTQSKKIKEWGRFLKDKKIYIADGHHRYGAALNFRNELRLKSSFYTGSEPYNYLLAYLTNMDSQELTILPVHRLISHLENLDRDELRKKLSHLFDITPLGTGEGEIGRLLSSMKKGSDNKEHLFGMYDGKSFYLLRLRDERELPQLGEGNRSWSWKRLDVTILHRVILDGSLAAGQRLDEKKIAYLTSAEEAFRSVREGKHQLAFFVNPSKVDQMRDIARAGEKMPGKATYFYPKLLTGLLMRKI